MAQIAAQAFQVNGVWHLRCAWFAGCGNPTLKAIEHPILGIVPTCTRCAAGLGKPLLDIEVSIETA